MLLGEVQRTHLEVAVANAAVYANVGGNRSQRSRGGR